MKRTRHNYTLALPPKTLTRGQSTRLPSVATRILVPIDFSDCSRCALHYAVSFAKSLRAALVLLYVAETNPPGSELGPSRSADLETDLRRIAKRELARLRNEEIPVDVKSQSVIRAGRADKSSTSPNR